MTETLRERQAGLARESMLEAAASVVAERGSLEFPLSAVAERAGVSLRTVYNYFGSRQDLIDAIGEWSTAKMVERGGSDEPPDLDRLGAAIRRNFELFGEMPEISAAFARTDYAAVDAAPPASQGKRTEAFRALFERSLTGLDAEAVAATAALVRTLASVRTWYTLTREHGLSSRQAGEAVEWAAERLTSAARSGHGLETVRGGSEE